jgi:hypothetical protein
MHMVNGDLAAFGAAHNTQNQNSHNPESSLNRLRIAALQLQYKSGLRFIFNAEEVP